MKAEEIRKILNKYAYGIYLTKERMSELVKDLESLLQRREELEKLAKSIIDAAKCPNPNCDNNGTIAVQVSEDEWEPEPCQWCDMKKDYLKSKKDEH